MGASWFVQPEIVRLPLSDGQFLDVKRELTFGEYRKIQTDMMAGALVQGEPIKLDPRKVGITRLLAYIVDWSLSDGEGRPTPISESAIEQLQADRAREIVDAVTAHEETQDRARRERLANPTGASGLRAIS
jgi:hypothetical protein